MDGWMRIVCDGWLDVKVGLGTAYCNQNVFKSNITSHENNLSKRLSKMQETFLTLNLEVER